MPEFQGKWTCCVISPHTLRAQKRIYWAFQKAGIQVTAQKFDTTRSGVKELALLITLNEEDRAAFARIVDRHKKLQYKHENVRQYFGFS